MGLNQKMLSDRRKKEEFGEKPRGLEMTGDGVTALMINKELLKNI